MALFQKMRYNLNLFYFQHLTANSGNALTFKTLQLYPTPLLPLGNFILVFLKVCALSITMN